MALGSRQENGDITEKALHKSNAEPIHCN